ncbi:MAG: methyltransferase domain-containing protein [Myxococcales bacterium]|nr:methyltransferase domain-containing protein [Myxococcales bacterium]
MAEQWNPAQYERFKSERAQPFYDLLSLVRPASQMRVVDLGCGTGELTRELHLRLGAAQTVGIDSSQAMLELSKAFSSPGLSFQLRDIGELEGRWDLVFSNAALQWLPDHPALFGQLFEAAAERGQLAVQLPANQDQPSHLVASEVAAEPPFAEALIGRPRQSSVLAPEAYAALLHRVGFREQQVHLLVYGHLLDSREEVVEWVKGTLLTDYQRRLPPELFPSFLSRYRERLMPRLEDQRPFFFPFKRLLLWARR